MLIFIPRTSLPSDVSHFLLWNSSLSLKKRSLAKLGALNEKSKGIRNFTLHSSRMIINHVDLLMNFHHNVKNCHRKFTHVSVLKLNSNLLHNFISKLFAPCHDLLKTFAWIWIRISLKKLVSLSWVCAKVTHDVFENDQQRTEKSITASKKLCQD